MSSTDWDKKKPSVTATDPTGQQQYEQNCRYFLGKLMVAGGSKSEADAAWAILKAKFAHNQIVKPGETERHDAIRQGHTDVIMFIQQCIKEATQPREVK